MTQCQLITQCLVTIMRKKLHTSGSIISHGYDLNRRLEADNVEPLKSWKYFFFSYVHKIIISRTHYNFLICIILNATIIWGKKTCYFMPGLNKYHFITEKVKLIFAQYDITWLHLILSRLNAAHVAEKMQRNYLLAVSSLKYYHMASELQPEIPWQLVSAAKR